MRLVVALPRRRLLRPISVALLGLSLGVASAPSAAIAQGDPGLAACSGERTIDCRLPVWPSAQEDLASPFGTVDGLVWLEDPQGDAPAGGIDVLAAGVGRVTIEDPKPVRESKTTLRRGKVKKAVPKGTSLVVRVVLDR